MEVRTGNVNGVHPRVGGETHSGIWRWVHPRVMPTERSIPAWAGKPARLWRAQHSYQVHPRVGGETAVRARNADGGEGPSPRGRGNLAFSHPHLLDLGSIPAWAGKPTTYGRSMTTPAVHPRVGGETEIAYGRENPVSGPSPRGRGNRAASGVSYVI